MNILVVDDEASVVDGLAAYLETPGHVVETARSLAEARRRLRSHNFDLVLSDLRMTSPGGKEGLELLRLARSSNSGEFVLMTGFASPEVECEARRKGVDRFLSKPFDLGELDRIVFAASERVADRSPASRGGGRGRAHFEPAFVTAKILPVIEPICVVSEEPPLEKPIIFVMKDPAESMDFDIHRSFQRYARVRSFTRRHEFYHALESSRDNRESIALVVVGNTVSRLCFLRLVSFMKEREIAAQADVLYLGDDDAIVMRNGRLVTKLSESPAARLRETSELLRSGIERFYSVGGPKVPVLEVATKQATPSGFRMNDRH